MYIYYIYLSSLAILYHVQIGKVLVAEVLSLLVSLLGLEEVADVDADEGPGRNIGQGPHAPPSLLCLEHLKLFLCFFKN